MPNPVSKGNLAYLSLIACTMHRKYLESVPLYRQEQQYKNLANWVIYGANTWLKALYKRMHEYLLKELIIHVDETSMQVLDEVGKKPTSKSYMGIHATGKYYNPISL